MIAAVGGHPLGFGQIVERGRGTGVIADLTSCDEEAQRAAVGISHGVQFRVHATLSASDQARETSFLPQGTETVR